MQRIMGGPSCVSGISRCHQPHLKPVEQGFQRELDSLPVSKGKETKLGFQCRAGWLQTKLSLLPSYCCLLPAHLQLLKQQLRSTCSNSAIIFQDSTARTTWFNLNPRPPIQAHTPRKVEAVYSFYQVQCLVSDHSKFKK